MYCICRSDLQWPTATVAFLKAFLPHHLTTKFDGFAIHAYETSLDNTIEYKSSPESTKAALCTRISNSSTHFPQTTSAAKPQLQQDKTKNLELSNNPPSTVSSHTAPPPESSTPPDDKSHESKERRVLSNNQIEFGTLKQIEQKFIENLIKEVETAPSANTCVQLANYFQTQGNIPLALKYAQMSVSVDPDSESAQSCLKNLQQIKQ